MIDAREDPVAAVEDDALHRSSYPSEAIDWIVRRAELEPRARVVELCAGTGAVASLFAARGYDVIGGKWSAARLARAEAKGGAPRDVRGEAPRTELPDHEARLVVAAQCLHTFDLERTFLELYRLLAPCGAVAAMWKVRADTPLMRAYEAALEGVAGERRTPRPAETLAALARAPGLVDRASFARPSLELLDLAGLLARARSSAHVSRASAPARETLDRALAALFEAHARDGVVELEHQTVVRFFRFAPFDLPDVRDGLTRKQRVVLLVLDELRRERGERNFATAEIYGRVTEKIDMHHEELIELLARMGARR